MADVLVITELDDNGDVVSVEESELIDVTNMTETEFMALFD